MILKTSFEVCHFNETIVPLLGGEKSLPKARREKFFPPLKGEKSVPEAWREMRRNVSTLSYLNLHTTQ